MDKAISDIANSARHNPPQNSPQNSPLAIYLHWPYCRHICPYCDFNIYKNRPEAAQALTDAMLAELAFWHKDQPGRQVGSVHFGGGTPSLMRPEMIGAVLTQIDRLWGLSGAAEIGLEANPNDADNESWARIARLGVNRLSLGVQTFSPYGLKILGRHHSPEQAEAAIELALSLFGSVSLDLIFGWARQDMYIWQADLDKALSAQPGHISTYQLTIEPGTAFAKAQARGENRAGSPILSADMYEMASDRLGAAGYSHYEVSNFARPAYESRHNLSYWLGHDYLGIGPGAHGRVSRAGGRIAVINPARPADYIEHIAQSGQTDYFGGETVEQLSAQAQAEEYLLMGLRITKGISLSRYQALAGMPLSLTILSEFEQADLIGVDAGRLWATPKGRLVLNKVTEKLLMG